MQDLTPTSPLSHAPELRELVIPFGDAGYVALYRHAPGDDAVYILAFRHQKEAGF
ncbi:plasmid stabilization system protein [Salinisphaera shabanensis E1L3A]|uniref:Plasmid stabilization system protein n=1 Tax=Salinisphaera shabanensis E1L3A TaxID=1033802 RepID=U2ENJ2_9GAMM|nr:type II toxin-antitoxin system RelE/ParE family toxin [Salinisphaera shabanensis]ERJ19415.1 plasmid stabilization system protein [Salinisphaera shabanensis E1L3A]